VLAPLTLPSVTVRSVSMTDSFVSRFVQEAHDGLHHLGDGLLELSMLLREQQDLLVHQVPVLCILCYCDDGDYDSGRGREI
jgi:hypothetical protein